MRRGTNVDRPQPSCTRQRLILLRATLAAAGHRHHGKIDGDGVVVRPGFSGAKQFFENQHSSAGFKGLRDAGENAHAIGVVPIMKNPLQDVDVPTRDNSREEIAGDELTT